MWAVIVGIIIAIAGVLFTFLSKKYDEEFCAFCCIFCWIVALFGVLISLEFGYYSFDRESFLQEKAEIEYLLEKNNADLSLFREAEKHNIRVDNGNNLWCRFEIEDRSEYKIDIIKILTKEEPE